MSSATKPRMERAVDYALLGMRVFPCYGVVDGKRCECAASDACDSPGKHPRITGWQAKATTDEATIRKWWRKWPAANIGCPTGDGWIVLDVDPAKGGRKSLQQLGELPLTPTAKTGRGGAHFYFHTTEEVPNAANVLPGLDVRGDGGFVVMPGSRGVERRYAWVRGRTPMQVAVADAPDALMERIRAGRNGHKTNGARLDTKRVLAGVEEGERDESLFRLASKLRWADVPQAAAKKIVLDAAAKCRPPFPADEARKKVRSAYERYKAGPAASRMTETANAKRLVALHGDDLRYVYGWRRWAIWDGTRWSPDDTGEVARRAKDAARTIYLETAAEENDKVRQQLASWAVKSSSAYAVRAMVELAQSEEGIALRPDAFDRDPWALNVKNGTLDLREGELRPHRRDDLIAKMAPVEYDDDAACPLWLAFLARIFDGKEDLIGFIQRAVGYSLTADVSEHLLFIAYGTGSNGKTVLLETIAALLGDYATAAAPGLLLLSRSDRHPTEVADLRGARFVHTVEVAEGRRLNEELVKKLTGGDTVRARRMREDFWEFAPTHKLWLATNYRPEIRGTDRAIWRRIRLIPFDVVIPPRERDKRLAEKLRGELPGILRWAVEGCLDWQRRGGLGVPPEVKEATREYRAESDTLAAFIEECCIMKDSARVSAADLYNAWALWAQQAGEHPGSQKRLGQQLRLRGFEPKADGRRRWWYGLRLAR